MQTAIRLFARVASQAKEHDIKIITVGAPLGEIIRIAGLIAVVSRPRFGGRITKQDTQPEKIQIGQLGQHLRIPTLERSLRWDQMAFAEIGEEWIIHKIMSENVDMLESDQSLT